MGEWGGFYIFRRLEFDHGFISVLNDDIRLYILVDVLDDTVNDPPSGDYFGLTFDVNRDGNITPDVDLHYLLVDAYNMRYMPYAGPDSLSGILPTHMWSSLAAGFGCFSGDGTQILYRPPIAPVCDNHRVFEFGIDLREIGAEAGGNVRMGLRIVSERPGFTDEVPVGFTHDFSGLIEVSLAPSCRSIPEPDQEASIGFDERYENDAIEVTQAVQDRDNTMPLVEGKWTAARVYVEATGVTDPQPVIVYLYGTRDGYYDLPGSPLSTLFMAPVYDPDTFVLPLRDRLDSTANFLLPDSWAEGTVRFRGRVIDLFGNEVSSTAFSLSFRPREVPVYWVVPINTGTADTPNLVSYRDMVRQESFLETVYPVPDVEFVQQPWEMVGATTPECDTVIGRLNDYYDSVWLAWCLSLSYGGEAVAPPDQIYGFLPRTCTTADGNPKGMSDPVWCGGRGLVAIGFAGDVTSVEPVMAHEIGHNLDRRPAEEATWGRHVGNPDEDTWGISNPSCDLSWGCGASGPDPDWPHIHDKILEVGFDTRQPWRERTGRRETVVWSQCPDFMSYCGQSRAPARWVSPYRWENLFNHAFSAPAASSLTSRVSQVREQIQTVYYVSGQVSKNDMGSLDPVLVQLGIPTEDIPPGDYAVEVQDTSAKPLLNTPFFVSFTDVEGNEVQSVQFRFQLPEQSGTSKILLKKGDQVLDQIVVSDNPPTVTVLAPNGGEQWSGRQTIQWQAEDEDGDPLSFTILYSPDKGDSWFPVAWDVQGQSYEVDTAILPGGDEARVRVIATDGFNTRQDDTDGTFWVQGKPPAAYIIRPEADTRFSPGEVIHLEGEASDVEDGLLPDESFIWSYDSTFFGVGRRANARFPAGTYEVTLTVVDSDGNTGQTTVVIFVGHQVYLPIVLKSFQR